MTRSTIVKKIICLVLLIGWGVGPITVYATDTVTSDTAEESGASLAGFSYKVLQPENQRDTGVTYFDLRMAPSQQQTVQIELYNDSAEERTLLVNLNGAKTNGSGVIEYSANEIPNDASLKFDFKDIVTAPESIVLPANGTAILDVAIAMPETTFDGIIAGGIELKFARDEAEVAAQTGVVNEYAYMIGLYLSETDTVVSPDLALNSVSGGQANFRNAVLINFSNTEAAFLSDLTMDVQITPENSNEVLYDSKKSGMSVAPNSMVNFPVSMNGDRMEPGNYRAIIHATAGDRRWDWDQTFTITDEEADQFNQEDVSLTAEEGINWVLIGMIVGGVLAFGILLFLILHFLRKNQTKKVRKKRTPKKKRKK